MNRCTILLLEDEPLILMDLEICAEERGCRVYAAGSIDAALALLGDCDPPPDVAVLDVSLQDGATCLPVAHELQRLAIPFILHSGDFDRQDGPLRLLDAPFVAKPARAEAVIAAALERIGDARQVDGAPLDAAD